MKSRIAQYNRSRPIDNRMCNRPQVIGNERVTIPNLCQYQPGSLILNDLENVYCGVACLANTVLYLSQIGVDSIVPQKGNLSEDEFRIRLIETILEHMEVGRKGIAEEYLMNGFSRYLKSRSPSLTLDFTINHDPKNVDQQMQLLDRSDGLIWGIDTYGYDSTKDDFRLTSSHYVLSASCSDDRVFSIHDPSPKSPREPLKVTLEKNGKKLQIRENCSISCEQSFLASSVGFNVTQK